MKCLKKIKQNHIYKKKTKKKIEKEKDLNSNDRIEFNFSNIQNQNDSYLLNDNKKSIVITIHYLL